MAELADGRPAAGNRSRRRCTALGSADPPARCTRIDPVQPVANDEKRKRVERHLESGSVCFWIGCH